MLELDDNTLVTDTGAMVAHIARVSGNASMLGSTPFQEAQVEQWMDYLRTETLPLVNAIRWFSFGQAACSTAQYNAVYGMYKDNMKVLNKHMNGRQFFAGDSLSVADVYFALNQVEMMQCLMDTNFRNSLNYLNPLFKSLCEHDAFKGRIGTIRQGKKQLLPTFSDAVKK